MFGGLSRLALQHARACRSCRHGDRCSRLHNRPTISQTILLQNMYQNPVINAPLGPDGFPIKVDERKAQKVYEVRAWTGADVAHRFAVVIWWLHWPAHTRTPAPAPAGVLRGRV